MSIVVRLAGTAPSPWELPGSRLVQTKPDAVAGGIRTQYELAAAIAATGRDVELRGNIRTWLMDEICSAAGVRLALDPAPRLPNLDDTIIVPEGWPDALFAPYVFSAARCIMMLLAPPGFAGWGYAGSLPWQRPDLLTVDPRTFARPEQFRAIAGLGFELWTHSRGLCDAAEEAGTRCEWIGIGSPTPFPQPLPKDVDVVVIEHNRWSTLATRVAEQLGQGVLSLGKSDHAAILRGLGRGRILAWPSRVEGHSRVQVEARAMATVPVALSTNRFAEGLSEECGALLVDTVEEMAPAIRSLLARPDDLERLSERAFTTARAQVDWNAYVDRVDAALARPAAERPAAMAMHWIMTELAARDRTLMPYRASRLPSAQPVRPALADRTRSIHPTARRLLGQSAATGVLVLGMHRSGTSAATRLVSLLGVSLGDPSDLKEPNPGNPTGYWEHTSLTRLNDEVLRTFGGAWAYPPELAPGWENDHRLQPLRSAATERIEVLQQAREWVWKDPRNCITLPFWFEALAARPVAIVILRNPLEIWRSLLRRGGPGSFTKAHVLVLWERYLRDLVGNLAGLPVHVTTYDDLVTDGMQWCSGAARFLAAQGVRVQLPDEDLVRRFVGARTAAAEAANDELERDREVSVAQRELWELLRTLAGSHPCLAVPDLPPQTRWMTYLFEERRRAEISREHARRLTEQKRRIERELRAARAEIRGLRGDVEQLGGSVTAARLQAKAAADRLTQVMDSRSMRYTAPVRALLRPVFKALRRR